MNSNQESIDSVLRNEGWLLKKIVPKEELPEAVKGAAIVVAKKDYFLDYQVIPDKIALGNNREWMPEKDSYLFYVKPTEKYLQEHKESITYLRFISRHVETGELSFQDY